MRKPDPVEINLMAALFVVALMVRALSITYNGLWADDAQLIWRSQTLAGALFTAGDTLPPLLPLCIWAITRLSGNQEIWLILPNLLASSALAPLAYAVTSRIVGRRAGLLAAALAVVNLSSIGAAQQVMPHALCTLLALWHFSVLHEWLTGTNRRPVSLVLSALLLALTHQWGTVILLAGLFLTVLQQRLESQAPQSDTRAVWLSYGISLPVGLFIPAMFFFSTGSAEPYQMFGYSPLAIDSWVQLLIKPTETVINQILTFALYTETYNSSSYRMLASLAPVITGSALIGLALGQRFGEPTGLWGWGIVIAIFSVVACQAVYPSSEPGPYISPGPYLTPPQYLPPFLGLLLVVLALGIYRIHSTGVRVAVIGLLCAFQVLLVLRGRQVLAYPGPQQLAQQLVQLQPQAVFIKIAQHKPELPPSRPMLAALTYYLRLVQHSNIPVIDVHDLQPVPDGLLQEHGPLFPPLLPPMPPKGQPDTKTVRAPPDPEQIQKQRLARALNRYKRVALITSGWETQLILAALRDWRVTDRFGLFNLREGPRSLFVLVHRGS